MSGLTNGLVHLMLLFWMWWYTRIRVVYNDLVLRIDTIILSDQTSSLTAEWCLVVLLEITPCGVCSYRSAHIGALWLGIHNRYVMDD